MDFVALYRKWRPQTFDEVVEQQSVVTILKNAVKSKRIAHAYLFSGTRGTGKTTMAKIFARAINCPESVDGNPCNKCEICQGILHDQFLDVSEIDAASNNGVDNIRSIIENASFAASRTEYKVYIIDEVHMLSQGAFNALLKTLEEPPEKVVFILATTEPHKLPVTILSRCQRYEFKRISQSGIFGRLAEICESSNVKYDEDALRYIAQKADGGLRDAISLLDQTIVASAGNITLKSARESAGSLDKEIIENFAEALLSSDSENILKMTDSLFASGKDPSNFIGDLSSLFRDILVILNVRNPEPLIYETGEELDRLRSLASMTNVNETIMMIRELSSLDSTLKTALQRKIMFEAGMLAICDRTWNSTQIELNEKIKYLEERVSDLVANGLKLARVEGSAPYQPAAPVGNNENASDYYTVQSSENEIQAEAQEDISSLLSPMDELDFKDFADELKNKKLSSVAALITTAAKRKYFVAPNKLYFVFEAEAMLNMYKKERPDQAVCEAATIAYGKPMRVYCVSKKAFAALTARDLEAEESEEEKAKFAEIIENIKNTAEAENNDLGGSFTVTEKRSPDSTPPETASFENSSYTGNAGNSSDGYDDDDDEKDDDENYFEERD